MRNKLNANSSPSQFQEFRLRQEQQVQGGRLKATRTSHPAGGESKHSWAPSSGCNAAAPRLSHKDHGKCPLQQPCPHGRVAGPAARFRTTPHRRPRRARSVPKMATAAPAEDTVWSPQNTPRNERPGGVPCVLSRQRRSDHGVYESQATCYNLASILHFEGAHLGSCRSKV